MSTIRPALAATPSLGRRARGYIVDEPRISGARADDIRLFAYTFLGGFLFMTVYLA